MRRKSCKLEFIHVYRENNCATSYFTNIQHEISFILFLFEMLNWHIGLLVLYCCYSILGVLENKIIVTEG
ncbi:hypothetical protein LINGRAHAP2_LOCUS35568 [Linum grandiflorum]